MKITIIDDEKDIPLLFNQQFRKEIKKGLVELEFAFSAKEALNRLEYQNPLDYPNLILVDINLPGANGLDLLKNIKNRLPFIKVFMMTAYEDEKTYQIAQEYGTDDYINKPIDFKKLKEKISNL